MDLTRTVYATNQRELDIGGLTCTRDEGDGACPIQGLLWTLREQVQECREMRENSVCRKQGHMNRGKKRRRPAVLRG